MQMPKTQYRTRPSGNMQWPTWPPVNRLHCAMLRCVLVALALVSLVGGQCPFPRNPHHASLHSDCVCGYSNVRRLSVQCSPVANFSQLLEVLHSPSVQRLPIDLLYINNASGLSMLPKNAFKHLDIQQIHLANTRLETIERSAFAGLENKLLSLTLQATGLKEIPVAEFRLLRSLRTLDLSSNKIRRIRADTFSELGQLATLRLAFNPDLQLDRDAFAGLERSLKNLNLKAIGAKFIPEAICNLTELAFLDLAQNKVEDIEPRKFARLHSLTALSLERNLIRSIHPDTFIGLNDSLSSLSLLNNLLVEFPQKALTKLTGLRVLDLGFNAIRQLPSNAFQFNSLLTLLALDGNPLKTISLQTFQHLNATLRGISIGGKAFECDCKVRWLAEWALEYNLQITSRERNPQFCAKPSHLRNKPFTHVDLNDFVCAPTEVDPVNPHEQDQYGQHIVPVKNSPAQTSSLLPQKVTTTTSTEASLPEVHYEHTTLLTTMSTSKSSSTTKPILQPATGYVQVIPVDEPELTNIPKTRAFTSSPPTSSTTEPSTTSKVKVKSPKPPAVQQASSPTTTLVMREPSQDSETQQSTVLKGSSSKSRHRSSNTTGQQRNSQGSLRLLDAIYRNNSIWLRWEPMGKVSSNGYQVVYRYFGSKEYHKSDQISAKLNSYTLTHFIAPNELIVICVLNLDESNDAEDENKQPSETPIPISQCKELTTRETIIKKPQRPPSTPSTTTSLSSFYPSLKRLNDIDKIVIAISAAVCLFIILSVLIFSCCFYRSVSKDSPMRAMLATNAKCLSTKSLSPMTKSSLDHEWETVSVYSTRSIPRARIANHITSPHSIPPPPTITSTIRSHISTLGHHGQTAPMSRYFGSTLPSKPTASRSPYMLEPYMHHYPSVSHLPAVSYGTTVTATGGGVSTGTSTNGYLEGGGYLRNASSLAREQLHSRLEHHRSRHEKGSSSSSSNAAAHRSHHRSRKSSKSRLKSSKMATPPGAMSELRIPGAGGSNNGSGGSYNRLLLSSSSNSFQSQNDYDSDHWNGGGYANSRSLGGTTASRMNDNEVDIYVDQNYARRFI